MSLNSIENWKTEGKLYLNIFTFVFLNSQSNIQGLPALLELWTNTRPPTCEIRTRIASLVKQKFL